MSPTRILALFALIVGLLSGGAAARADFAAGLAAYDAGDYETAIAEWRPLAEDGDPAAQVAVAGLYRDGLGVRADLALAANWYRRAAEQGDPVAQLNLGEMTARGLGVARDPVMAWAWLGLAAEQGRSWARREQFRVDAALNPAERSEARRRLAELRRSFGPRAEGDSRNGPAN